MADDMESEPDGVIVPNDNEDRNGQDNETWRRLDQAVLTIARLIGRRMAREQFAAISAANDNEGPEGEGEDSGKDGKA
jgi:hypothetical protein